jgi:hypothetical protein
MSPVDLGALVNTKLEQLPTPKAPPTLLPRVLQAVREWAERPWYARAWLTWPVGWQAASLLSLVLLVGAVVWIWPDVQAAVGTAAPQLAAWLRIVSRVEATTHAGRVVWWVLLAPVAAVIVVFTMVMCALGVAVGTMLNRVAIGKA